MRSLADCTCGDGDSKRECFAHPLDAVDKAMRRDMKHAPRTFTQAELDAAVRDAVTRQREACADVVWNPYGGHLVAEVIRATPLVTGDAAPVACKRCHGDGFPECRCVAGDFDAPPSPDVRGLLEAVDRTTAHFKKMGALWQADEDVLDALAAKRKEFK